VASRLETETAAHKTNQGEPVRYSGFSKQYINGAWRPGRGPALVDVDPYEEETLVEIPFARIEDLDEAYASAAKAQKAWAARFPSERETVMLRAAEVIEERREEIIDWLARESGSTRIKSEFELRLTLAITLEAASFPHRMAGRILPSDEPGQESRSYRQPIGVVGIISPWNFPLYLSQRSVAPALALGNGVVLKPASDTPVTGGLLLAKIFEEAGLPPGLFNVVVGSSKEIGDPFVEHPIPRLISFTGSTTVGQRVASLAVNGEIVKRVALELGGNSPCVILEDADLDQAVPAAVFSRFLHQGQICMSSNRIIVDAAICDEFTERFTDHTRKLKYGDPKDSHTVIGPIINRNQLQNMMDLMKKSVDAGARKLVGGDPEGLVLPPHVFGDVTNHMPIAERETFGPIAPIIRVHGDAEALAVANDTPFGLSSAVFTRDGVRGLRFAKQVEAGMTHINGSSVEDTRTGPFGGEKNSGIGRFGGEWAMQEFTTDHWITAQHAPRQYPF
jgi:aldehyde dehydrogenase (NAD+)